MTIPVHIITGFLGSGKTTLLNRLLASPELADTAVLINEFGEMPVDHLLVENINDEIVVLESGCVCCSVRDDLSGSLQALREKRDRNQIPPFRRVILETTGIADPLPVCHQIMTDATISDYYSNGSILTVVDGVYGSSNLDRQVESVRQVVIADHVILTKLDLAAGHERDSLETRLRALNPSAPILRNDTVSGPGPLLSALGRTGARTEPHRWLASITGNDLNQSMETDHGSRFDSFCLRWHEPVDWEDFTAWLDALLLARGEQIFRIKGLIRLEGETRPILIQGVQHSIYAPVKLASWPGESQSELIFITEDFPGEAVVTSIHQVLNVHCVN